MFSKQTRNTNILLFLILLVLIVNLIFDALPYMITASILGSIFRPKPESNGANFFEFLGIKTKEPEIFQFWNNP